MAHAAVADAHPYLTRARIFDLQVVDDGDRCGRSLEQCAPHG
jgi:hypothetical protein